MKEGSATSWISIEGGIGAGKSTLLNIINDNISNCVVVPENHGDWIKSGILELSYSNPKEFTFISQTKFFTSRIQGIRDAHVNSPPDYKYLFSERSPWTDKIFMNLKKDQNNITDLVYDIYMGMWKEFQNLLPWQYPKFFIYLKVSIDDLMKRKDERGRKEETLVDYEYQQTLIEQHELLLLDPKGVLMPNGIRIPCFVIDGSVNFKDDPTECEKILKAIKKWIQIN